VDVRSEGEFEQGHIPAAVNLPLLTNAERVQVGTDYKQKGQAAAIKTGFRLVGPRLEQIIAHTEQLAAGNELLAYCWRGGLRSQYFCQFASMAHLRATPLIAGYKGYRQQVMQAFQKPYQLLILGGCTGSGKTEILQALARAGEQVIDLEGLANHKGSVFGGLLQPPQPTTEQFQNNLFEQLLLMNPDRPIWVEDESVAIGKIFLPDAWWRKMNRVPIFEIDLNKEQRVARLVQEYGSANPDAFIEAVRKIARRLGALVAGQVEDAVRCGNMAAAIDQLLGYYDRAYRNALQIKGNSGRVCARIRWEGRHPEIVARELLARSLDLKLVALGAQHKIG